MFEKRIAPTWAEINLDNLEFNLNNIKKILKKNTKICTVLKANAYGHGSVKIAQFLQDIKVDYIAVSRLEEAMELRQNNINIPILCLGYIPDNVLEIAIENDITMTVYSLETANIINEICKETNSKAKVHIKVDTGMSRIGFMVNGKSVDDIYKINELECVEVEGIYTHFTMADESDKTYTYKQVEDFNFIIEELEKLGVNIEIKHVSNSAATMDLPDLQYDMVRCGIVLYGYHPSEDVKKENLHLKPIMTLKTTVSNIKTLGKDIGISYGHKYKTTKFERIAAIPIGYADGFTRIQKNPKAIIQGEEFDVVGRICMDQCMVRIDKDIDIKTGDEVIIFGEGQRTADDLAADLETINYEIICMLSRRVELVYMAKNAIVQVNSYLVK